MEIPKEGQATNTTDLLNKSMMPEERNRDHIVIASNDITDNSVTESTNETTQAKTENPSPVNLGTQNGKNKTKKLYKRPLFWLIVVLVLSLTAGGIIVGITLKSHNVMPDVVGLNPDEAKEKIDKTLKEQSLKFITTDGHAKSWSGLHPADNWFVVSTLPAAGQTLNYKDTSQTLLITVAKSQKKLEAEVEARAEAHADRRAYDLQGKVDYWNNHGDGFWAEYRDYGTSVEINHYDPNYYSNGYRYHITQEWKEKTDNVAQELADNLSTPATLNFYSADKFQYYAVTKTPKK